MPNRRRTFLRAPAAVLTLLLLAGCAARNPANTQPAPAQLQVANAVNALAQSLDAAITGLQAARSQGKLSAPDVTAAEKVAAAIATTGKQIDRELKSSDPWSTQKTVILNFLTAAGLQGAMRNLNSNAAATLAGVITLVNQISTAVGGPTI